MDPEPRVSLRRGTIPKSVKIPFEDLLINQHFKSKEDFKTVFKKFANQYDNLTFSCGSGITACVLALGAEVVGYSL